MNKEILLSIQPEWLVKILNGEKTIEIRKSIPKCELPIDVYLYCTKEKPYITQQSKYQFTIRDTKDYTNLVNGKVVAKFTLNYVSTCLNTDYGNEEILKNACLTKQELDDYVGKRKFFAWHIDNLVVFDKPMELGKFLHEKKYVSYSYGYHRKYIEYELRNLIKAPQSWQYVYVKEKENDK